MKHISQLDSLRAVAIVTVVIVHWFPKDNLLFTFCSNANAPSFFFTLSGFLITTILIKNKVNRNLHKTSKAVILKNFYLKRSLRLFPGYFLVIGIWWLTKPGTEPFRLTYFATFTSNIYTWKIQQWPALAHLWSMAVEEQFYLCWPLVILFTSRKYLAQVILSFAVFSVIWQHFYTPNEYARVLTFSCLDSLSIGSFLAYLVIYKPNALRKYYTVISTSAGLSLMWLVLQVAVYDTEFVKNRTLVSVITFWVITFFLIKGYIKTYLLAPLLENRLLKQMGKLSYGIYLYHFILPYFTNGFLTKAINLIQLYALAGWENYFLLAENFTLLLGLSYLSFYYIELPVQKLKRFLVAPANIEDTAGQPKVVALKELA